MSTQQNNNGTGSSTKGFLPFGRIMLAPSLLALVAFIFSTSASFHCSFFHVTKPRSAQKAGYGLKHTHTSTIKVGIWTTEEDWAYAAPDSEWDSSYVGGWSTIEDEWRQGSQTCVSWFDSKLGKLPDRAVKFSRMMTIAVLIGGIFLLTLMFAYALWDPLFCVDSDRLDKAIPDRQNWPQIPVATVCVAACALFGFITLLFLSVLGSKACAEDRVERCKLAASGYLSIFSALLWWSAAAVMFFLQRVFERKSSTSPSGDEAPPTMKDIEELEATDVDEGNSSSED